LQIGQISQSCLQEEISTLSSFFLSLFCFEFFQISFFFGGGFTWGAGLDLLLKFFLFLFICFGQGEYLGQG